jgi:type III pantothenate kinase
MVVGKSLKSGLSIRIDNPNELGTDLVADSVGGKSKYGYPLLITDMGTATKILVIDKDGNFVGCVIAPGIKVAMMALTKKSAQLMDIDLVAPEKIIGKNSPDSLNSGSIYGNIAMIEGMNKMIEKELGYPCKKIITGGYSAILKEHLDKEFIFDPTLIFEGLYQIYLKNGGKI